MGMLVERRNFSDLSPTFSDQGRELDVSAINLVAQQTIKCNVDKILDDCVLVALREEIRQQEATVGSLVQKISIESHISEEEVHSLVYQASQEGTEEAVTRVTQTVALPNLIQLIIAIQKLSIHYRDLIKFSRREERDLQIKQMLATADGYKKQAKWIFNMAIGAGIAGIAAGVIPIAGYLRGSEIVAKLKEVAKPDYDGLLKYIPKLTWVLEKIGIENIKVGKEMKLFTNFGQMFQSTAQAQQSMTQGFSAFGQAETSRSEKLGEMARTDGDEFSRQLQEQLEDGRQYKQFLDQILQYEQNSAGALYR